MTKTILALVPHPDDAEFYAGGTLAMMVAAGARLHLVIATDGRCGSFAEEGSADQVAATRAEEMRRAAAVLGAEPPVLLDHPDMGLDTLPPGTLREEFVRAIRRCRPDVLFAQDPYALYEPHPDHRAVAWAATEALTCASLPLVYPQHLAEGLEPHFVAEKYFYGDTLPGANKVVDITAFMDRKLAALAEHRSQVVFLVEGVLRQARLAGLDVAQMLGPDVAGPMALLAWGVRAGAAAVGGSIGVAYAEAYRYQRYSPLIEAALPQEPAPGGAA